MATTKGIMGFLDLQGSGGVNGLRVTSCGLKASQEVSAMETIDNAYDYTAYRLGPVRIEGDITFPIPVENNQWDKLIKVAAQRDGDGVLQNRTINVLAGYDHTVAYEYKNCSVNTYSVTINSEEAVEVTMNLIGTERVPKRGAGPKITGIASPQRVLTWNEIEITAGGTLTPGGDGVGTFLSEQVKNFSFEINNNTTVFFGLNKEIIAAQNNIVAGKREVTGSMEVAWNGSGLENVAYLSNVDHGKDNCGSGQWINAEVIANCGAGVAESVKFHGIIYNMEDISMTNDFFMGTQTWKAYGTQANDYKAIELSVFGAI